MALCVWVCVGSDGLALGFVQKNLYNIKKNFALKHRDHQLAGKIVTANNLFHSSC